MIIALIIFAIGFAVLGCSLALLIQDFKQHPFTFKY